MCGAHPAERVALQIEIAPRSDEIERGLIAARELRDAGEADEIAAARAKIANVTAKLEAWGRGEGFKKD